MKPSLIRLVLMVRTRWVSGAPCQSINRLLQPAFFIINVACLALLAKSNNSEAVWSGHRI